MTAAEKQAAIVARNKAQRVLRNGVWVHPLAPHGTQDGYVNFGCRCNDCRAANNATNRRLREEYARARIEVDGVLVAPNAEHGKASTYKNYSCRCTPCSQAQQQARVGR